MEEVLLTFKETRERLNVTERQLRDLVWRKRVPYKKVGKFLRFSPTELDAWLSENSHGLHYSSRSAQ